MKRALLLCSAILMTFTTTAHATINLAWDDCGAAGTDTERFACDGNTGTPFSLIGSFIPSAQLNGVVAADATILVIPSDTFPDWWKFGSTECRGAIGLTGSFDFTFGPFTCTDPWSGQAVSALAYDLGYPDSTGARVRVQGTLIDGSTTMEAGREYYVFKLNIARSRTTGAGACAGCATAVCLVLNDMTVYMNTNDTVTETSGNTAAYWHDAFIYIWDDFEHHRSGIGCAPGTPTETARSTWGRVKSLYR